MHKILFCSFIFLLSAKTAHAQNASEDGRETFKKVILKMQEEYKNMDKLHLIMSIEVFENATATKPYYNEVADIKRDKNNYLYTFAGQEMLMNDKYLLMVDRAEKEIFCNKRNLKSEQNTFKDAFQVNIDSLLNFYGETKYLGKKEQLDHFQLFQKTGQVSRIDLFIDSFTGLLKRIDYAYNDDQFVKIEFKVFDRAPQFNTAVFDERNYIVIQKEKLTASEKFKGYRLSEVSQN